MNISDLYWKPSDKCWNWCADQQLINESNKTAEGMFLLLIAAALNFMIMLVLHYCEIDEKKLQLVYMANMGAMCLIIGYVVYWRWFL